MLQERALTDPLTGLSNRLSFRENLDRRVLELSGTGRQMALLFARRLEVPVVLTDLDSDIESATVSISNPAAGDVLSWDTLPSGVTTTATSRSSRNSTSSSPP